MAIQEHTGIYRRPAKPARRTRKGDAIIAEALGILERRLRRAGHFMSDPQDVEAFCTLNIATLEHEEFWLLLLDNHHRLIAVELIAKGSISDATVPVREVVKAALRHNAAAVIAAHNHPSGVPTPSKADIAFTIVLGDALKMVDTRLLDHIVIGGMEAASITREGLRDDGRPAAKPKCRKKRKAQPSKRGKAATK